MPSIMDKLKNAGSIKAEVLSESTIFNCKDIIDTNVPIINMAFSGDVNGGFTTGLTILAGESKTFKTMMSLYCLRAYQEKYKDSVCLFYDCEFGVTPAYLKTFGIDSSRVIHIPIEHVEQLKFDIVNRLEQIKRGDKVFLLVDSLGNLASKKEVEDAISEKSVADMSRAKAIRSLLRIITPHLSQKDIPCFIINHIYLEQGMFPKTVIPGGCLAAGTKIRMYDGTEKNIENIEIGDLVLTLEGAKPVENIWNPETLVEGNPECFEIEFEDGYKVICSDNHPFLTQNGWVAAKDLTDQHEITQIC